MTTLAQIPLSAIAESSFNPRKSFNAAKLQELADSIQATGLHQPILVRPLPAARVPDTGPAITHEIVAGARRYRACKLVMRERDAIPAIVRELTDAQALEIAVIENLQRDDLTALEEAEGYQHLRDASGLNVDQIGAKIGKSRAYVYARLKLLDLAPEPRQALADGTLDASSALLIARIPDSKLQAQATREIADDGYDRMSARRVADHIQANYMLRLNDAKFSKADATLLPDAGACTTCPKRTGANPELFSDVKGADICTDPPCFRLKEEAHQAVQLRAARASGAEIIEGREARRLMPNSWTTHVEGHLRLDDAADSPTDKPLRKLIGQQMEAAGIQPVLVASPYKEGQLIAVLPAEQVAPLLAAAGQAKAADRVQVNAERDAKEAEEEALQKAEDALEQGWRHEVLDNVITSATGGAMGLHSGPDSVKALCRYAALHFVGQLRLDECKALAKRLDLGKVAPREGLEQWTQGHPQPAAALAILIAARDVAWARWQHENGRDTNTGLWLAAEALGIDAKDIERCARSDARAEAMAAQKAQKKAAQADPPPAPAAPARGVASAARNVKYRCPMTGQTWSGRGQKPAWVKAALAQGKTLASLETGPAAQAAAMGEAQARQGIAAALQAQEGSEPGAAEAAQRDDARPVLRPAAIAPGGGAASGLTVGQQVKVLASATGNGARQWIGKTGTIEGALGARSWDVAFTVGRKGFQRIERRGFDVTELEVV